ncbi:MAG TPA: hypothetical protein VN203_17560 [Candidatus Acidoferrum sp.]|nr:hypothetical protein [Candidatus Methylomirabilis sp.]HWU39458.1 hypothetical protein [Candidatus Acidoferrum sp.]
MKVYRVLTMLLALASFTLAIHSAAFAQSLKERNDALLARLQQVHNLSEAQMQAIRGIFSASGYLGEGNPAVTQHPLTPEG